MNHIIPKNPKIIDLPKIGSLDKGYISFIQVNDLLPFYPKRVYWIYGVTKDIKRGNHYHKKLEQLIICLNGKVDINIENLKGDKKNYTLDKPSKALYVPSGYWREIHYKKNSMLLCVASEIYDENDYVRDYKKFKNIS